MAENSWFYLSTMLSFTNFKHNKDLFTVKILVCPVFVSHDQTRNSWLFFYFQVFSFPVNKKRQIESPPKKTGGVSIRPLPFRRVKNSVNFPIRKVLLSCYDIWSFMDSSTFPVYNYHFSLPSFFGFIPQNTRFIASTIRRTADIDTQNPISTPNRLVVPNSFIQIVDHFIVRALLIIILHNALHMLFSDW